jgi:hypothetical protein
MGRLGWAISSFQLRVLTGKGGGSLQMLSKNLEHIRLWIAKEIREGAEFLDASLVSREDG